MKAELERAREERSTHSNDFFDDAWNPYDPRDRYNWYNDADDADIDDFNVTAGLEEALSAPPLYGQLRTLVAAGAQLNPSPKPPELLEKDLFEYTNGLKNLYTGDNWTKDKITNPYIDRGDIQLLLENEKWAGSRGSARQLAIFFPFWIRSLQSWKPSSDISLFKHLFCHFDAPPFLEGPWTDDWTGPLHNLKWLNWFILIGQGSSLRRASRIFGWSVSGKFASQLRGVPIDMPPLLACLYAEVKRLGGSIIEFNRLAANPAYVFDPTQRQRTPDRQPRGGRTRMERYLCFWRGALSWLIQNRERLTDDESIDILDWACAQPWATNEFTWRGRNYENTLSRARAFRSEVEHPYKNYAWRNQGWDLSFDDQILGRCKVVELTSGSELINEGKTLQHCVSSYVGRCMRGHSAIFSFRVESVRRLTIELDPASGRVVQATGLRNRFPTGEERAAIRIWRETAVKV